MQTYKKEFTHPIDTHSSRIISTSSSLFNYHMKRRGFVRNYIDQVRSNRKDEHESKLYKLPHSNSKQINRQGVALTDIYKSVTTHNKSERTVRSKNVNISSLIGSYSINKKTQLSSRRSNKSLNISHIIKNNIRQSDNIDYSNINDIISNSNFQDKKTHSIYWDLPLPERTNLNDMTPFQETFKNIDPNSLISQLQNSLYQLNSKLKILSNNNNSKFDTLLTIDDINNSSPKEIIVTNSYKKWKYVLHNPKNDRNHIPDIRKIHLYKLAINSKAVIKLNNELHWCLQWKFVPIMS